MTLKKLGAFLLLALVVSTDAAATGFGLYEASTPTYALGGTVIGRAYDASANFYNPATLTDLGGTTVTLGFMTEHPRARIKTEGRSSSEVMDSGVFVLPHFHLAVPLPWEFVFGLGVMPEYGLGTAYGDDWSLSYNSRETTVTSATVNPNLAWKFGDLSVGAGLRFLYFDFEQRSHPIVGMHPQLGEMRFRNRLKGDNNMEDFGYQVGMKYDVFENFAIGVVYKSETEVHVKGTTRNHADDATLASAAAAASGDASTEITLPQSITGGFNWDVTDDWHLGGMVAWTQWSSIGILDFNLAGTHKDIRLNWEDSWRVGLAPSWDFAEDWTAMCSYVFETDCCGGQESTMLPAADRHMLSLGLTWRCWAGLELGLCYGVILMDGKRTQARNYRGELDHYRAHRGVSHATGFTVTYRF